MDKRRRWAPGPMRPGLAWLGWLGWLGMAGWPLAVRAADTAAVAHVTATYRQIAWQAVLETGGSGPGLLDSAAARLSAVFDPALTALLLRQQRCLARSQGTCALDFDPLWDSQDPLGTTAAVAPGARPDEVRVVLRRSGGRQTTLVHQLVLTPAGWRIADIRFGGQRPSLKTLLQTNP